MVSDLKDYVVSFPATEMRELQKLILQKNTEMMTIPDGYKVIVGHLETEEEQRFYLKQYLFDAQSAGFMAEISIIFQQILLKLRLSGQHDWGTPFTVYDIGARTAVGTNLLGLLFKDFMPFKVNFVPVDINDKFKASSLAENIHLDDYLVGDVFDMEDKSCDFAICSHTLEHIKDPIPFAEKVRNMARYASIFYCPYNETNPIPGHFTVSPETLEELNPAKTYLVNSHWWGHGRKEGKLKNVMFILNGSEGVDFSETELIFEEVSVSDLIISS